ncbi:MAG TPA: peptide transporter [Planctomycetota bacterium]|nr:peptide transporter [Planctomycetota bacterium]HRR82116.1 peptide transporter [Planctomycetota bacterium]
MSVDAPQPKHPHPVIDRELEEYRNLLETPSRFGSGFTWASVAGALFCGLLMFPGAIYLGLMSGVGMNVAATWVTVIVFSEVARRALRAMTKEEMVILLMVASAMIGGSALLPGGPFGQLIWRQFLVTSDAVKDAGLYGQFPAWFAPAPDSPALVNRTFFDSAWAVPIALLVFMAVIGFVQQFTLGYALFRLCSDVERLPFPMAPVGAQGVMALCEGEKGDRTWRWTVFSLGAMVGVAFGLVQVGVPAVSSAFLEKPIVILPIPWFDLTRVTEDILPATPTGIILDLGLVLTGFVIPFWAVVGSALSVVLTFVLNPILYRAGVLASWKPGMDTINTQVCNSMDFYFSAGIGMALGVAAVSVFQTVRQLRASLREMRANRAAIGGGASLSRGSQRGDTSPPSLWATPPGRGDWSLKLCAIGYAVSAAAVVAACKALVPGFPLFFLVLFAFAYTPLTSYLNARIAGIAGLHVDIPFVREAFILLSGARGVAPWIAPMPIENYGGMAQSLRTLELTGTRLTSQVKAWLLTTPLIFVLSLVFWSFLWADAPIPCDLYPYAQKMWDLTARNTMILWTATTGEPGTVTLFERSFHPEFLGAGFGFSVLLFAVLSAFGLPTMLVYGLARGLGAMPHGLLLELTGALLARYYLHRRFGRKPFLLAAPILLAGYLVGTGLIGMVGVAIRLITSAISMAPF